MDAESLAEKLKRAASGDALAFREVYEAYGRKIFNFIYRLVGHREEAEDLTQDTFVLAFKNLKRLRNHMLFESWLYKIARNEVYQRFRKPAVDADALEGGDRNYLRILKSTRPSDNPERNLLNSELNDHINRALNCLPLKYKEVFILAVMHGKSYEEISRIVGRSLLAVKSDIYRARLILRQEIGNYLRPKR